MYHAAVVAGLMLGNGGFFFKEQQTGIGFLQKDVVGSGQSNNSSANNGNVVFHNGSDAAKVIGQTAFSDFLNGGFLWFPHSEVMGIDFLCGKRDLKPF
jgi:hypothetical protein